MHVTSEMHFFVFENAIIGTHQVQQYRTALTLILSDYIRCIITGYGQSRTGLTLIPLLQCASRRMFC